MGPTVLCWAPPLCICHNWPPIAISERREFVRHCDALKTARVQELRRLQTPVVLLHGFPETWHAWRHQIPALGGRCRLIVPVCRRPDHGAGVLVRAPAA